MLQDGAMHPATVLHVHSNGHVDVKYDIGGSIRLNLTAEGLKLLPPKRAQKQQPAVAGQGAVNQQGMTKVRLNGYLLKKIACPGGNLPRLAVVFPF